MYIQMLKNQQVTFVNNRDEAERFSPYHMWWNHNSDRFVVSRKVDDSGCLEPIAAGMSEEEAIACVMYKANEFILRSMNK